MRIQQILLALALGVSALFTGCAHPITVGPVDASQIKASGTSRIGKSVGYFVAPEDAQREVTTGGGGGDKVSYKPYADLDPGLYRALSEVFANVTKMKSANEAAVPGSPLRLVILPKIFTNSSSSSALTWPPTDFSIELVCKVTDPAGAVVTEVKGIGKGHAEYDEFKNNHSLSANRATQEALVNLVKALEADPALRR
ncbi:hypothetical protein [Rhizobacter sp. SG703]|uniref:hypothetical protein n=1 Tax=Rhizobacter sp. SG703 TaxID=2587140 RepID=UPI0014483784|nr:hypothetical protein [Rhizobacter sp. SG703]NKI94548.1 hypothetical protein [Rhizobacter sp. SG703]